MADIHIKPDPEAAGASPGAFSDEDIYEDAGDLDFSKAAQNLWLMRLPKYVWDNWSQIKDDEEIRLGTVRVETTPSGQQEIGLLLSPSEDANQGLPREYRMAITNAATINTFIFTEQDLPDRGTKGKAAVRGSQPGNRPAKSDRKPWDRYPRYQPYLRKPIPKQTSLVGAVKHEVNCLPVENAEFSKIMAERNREAMRPKVKTVVIPIKDLKGESNIYVPGTLGSTGPNTSFIRTATSKATKVAQDNKAARMPRNELLDAIFQCFRKYNYWSLKTMKAELNQPEAYLKQVLESVAVLVRSGQFAMTYTLKPENRLADAVDLNSDSMAPDQGSFDGAVDDKTGQDEDMEEYMKMDDEDEDDVKMEDDM